MNAKSPIAIFLILAVALSGCISQEDPNVKVLKDGNKVNHEVFKDLILYTKEGFEKDESKDVNACLKMAVEDLLKDVEFVEQREAQAFEQNDNAKTIEETGIVGDKILGAMSFLAVPPLIYSVVVTQLWDTPEDECIKAFPSVKKSIIETFTKAPCGLPAENEETLPILKDLKEEIKQKAINECTLLWQEYKTTRS